MPYIDERRRGDIAYQLERDLSPGELNFVISDLIDQWIGQGISYGDINTAMGILACVQAELYRKVAAPYEEKKERENGLVYRERP